MTDTQAFVAAGTATQPQRFVIAEGETADDAQASGAWVSAANPSEVRR